MGREIRKVPPNWEHPISEETGNFQPMHDETYASAVQTWKDDFAAWERGARPSYFDDADYPNGIEFWEWENGPPDKAYYRPWSDSEATWIQVWETVSEGTPVTPPFETPEELVDYLSTHGDFWDQKRGDKPWARANAEAFVNRGWAPSMVMSGGGFYMPKDGLPEEASA